MSRERVIINNLLAFCLALGFVCLTFVYLPGVVPHTAVASAPEMSLPMASLVQLPETTKTTFVPQEAPGQTVIARFTPEPEPQLPMGLLVPEPRVKVEAPTEAVTPEVIKGGPPLARPSSLATAAAMRNAKGQQRPDWLTVPATLAPDVEFWKKIYADYTSNQIVLHDARDLKIVYRVLDVTDTRRDPFLNDLEKEKRVEATVEDARNTIKAMLQRIASSETASGFTDDEWMIYKTFQPLPGGREKYLAAADRIRAQQGLKDKFVEGLKYSGRMLGEMEAIFEARGLPMELTRLVFVESMFNPAAHSAVGASGLWQIMPSTARRYGLMVGRHVDDRRDPILATRAAAKILQENYDDLGSWPLAINAYNSGLGRMRRAVTQLGTKDIADIVRRFEHPGYAFASRNFFCEFLAAVEVTERAPAYFGSITYDEPVAVSDSSTSYQ
ncbi:MAG: lytic transglycosylase domain-containing protein [Deltaproteobacteria bacterium]|nr:lytic transglycosylase domain-containing protein [Deltaproteobacteria bacterium]